MLLKKVKALVTSKIVAVLSFAPASFGLVSCVYGSEHCCAEYPYPEAQGEELLAYQQMCYTSVAYSGCKLKKVDCSIFKALECCKPLNEGFQGISHESFRALPEILKAGGLSFGAASFFLPVYAASFSQEDGVSMPVVPYTELFYLPTNAYTWCFLNSDPETCQCDIQNAQAFEQTLDVCCGTDGTSEDRRACALSMVQNDGMCPDK